MKSRKVEFTPPQEVTDQLGSAPAGTRLELMTKFVVKNNGAWCIASIEGVPMPGYDGEGRDTGDKQETMDMDGGERMASKMKEMMGSATQY